MPTAHHQSQQRIRLSKCTGALHQHRMDVPLKMVYRNQRLAQPERQRLRKRNAYQQRAREARPFGHSNGIDLRIRHTRAMHRLAHHRQDRPQVLAAGELRHHAAVARMDQLRSHHIRQHLRPAAHHRRRGLIAGGLDTEDEVGRHSSRV
jgi:hypothetical protein